MFMRYLMDLVQMKKPKWYQFTTIMKNRSKISSAKFYIKSIQDIDTDGELCETTRDFMNSVEYMLLNGYSIDCIIPEYVTTFRIISMPGMEQHVVLSDLTDKYFSIQFEINNYIVSISTKSIITKVANMNRDLNVDIYYKKTTTIVPGTIALSPLYKKHMSLYDKVSNEVLQYIKDFMEVVMRHMIREIIYLYQ